MCQWEVRTTNRGLKTVPGTCLVDNQNLPINNNGTMNMLVKLFLKQCIGKTSASHEQNLTLFQKAKEKSRTPICCWCLYEQFFQTTEGYPHLMPRNLNF